MPSNIDAVRTDIERWILSELSPEPSTTVDLAYERMESQSGECLPVIYLRLDHTKRGHWHDEALVAAFVEAVRSARTVLDVGPGDGWPSLRMSNEFERIVGVDPSPRRVRVQRENAARLRITNVEFLEMDAVSLDFPDESFGGVTAASSIEQTSDPGRALREVFRVLEPGGSLAMVFEDYADYFPNGAGDEELWTEFGDGPPVLFYQARTKHPARETKYGLFLDEAALASGAVACPDGTDDGARRDLKARLRSLARDASRPENLADGDTAPRRTEELGVPFLEGLLPLVTGARCFELRHFTSESLDAVLAEIGFEDVRHLDHRLPELRAFFDRVTEEGGLGEYATSFREVSRKLGREAVRAAQVGVGDFAIARKPR